MNYLVDNDIAIKLALTGLLDQVCSMFGMVPSNTLRLASLKFVALKKLDKQELATETKAQISQRIIDFCTQYRTVSEPGDRNALERLSSPGIDPGEALLLARAVVDPAAVVLTGDRRCVLALTTDPNLRPIAQVLQGRVEILESLFLRLIDRLGFGTVRDLVLDRPSADGMLTLAFSTREADPQAHAREALLSAEEQIERVLPAFLWRRS